MSNDEVRVHEDASALAADVASALLARLEELQEQGEVPHVGLTGGTIAGTIHQELGRRGPESDVDWSRVVFWWGDERFVDADSEDRNDLSARRDFLDPLGVPADHVHPVPATGAAASAEASAAEYAETLGERWKGFDVLLLGLGPDGHVASLFPGRPELEEDQRLTAAVHDSPKPPPDRVTLTFLGLRRSDAVWFVVSGGDKAEAVAASRREGPVEECPARGVRGAEETVWWLDEEAAREL